MRVYAGTTSHGFKMKRITLMKLVCVETARIDAVRVQQLPYVFQRLPLNVQGNLPLSEVCTHSKSDIYVPTQTANLVKVVLCCMRICVSTSAPACCICIGAASGCHCP